MKKFFAIIITALFISITANAQGGRDVLRGSDKSTEKIIKKTQNGDVQKVNISLRNNSPLPRKFMVISYEPSNNGSNGTNGVVLMPTFSKSFQFEVGTRIFIADSEQVDTVMGGKKLTGTPFLTVKAEDAGKIFSLNK